MLHLGAGPPAHCSVHAVTNLLRLRSRACRSASFARTESRWAWATSRASTQSLSALEATLGKAYGARATPHMFVIDPQGKLVYAGAIDSKPSTNPEDIKTATNYVG